jgi:hypothetical protein
MLRDHKRSYRYAIRVRCVQFTLTAGLLRDAVYGVVSREGCPFLPAHEMREIVSGEIGSALRFI